MPTVSIIVPVHNAAATLPRCVQSILSQEYRDLELILVDDGSTDESPELCDDLAEGDDRVIVIHQQNAGVSEARNAALDRARGTYVQFADADDWLAPSATKLMVRAAEDHDCDLVIADFYRVVDKRVARKGDIDLELPLTREEFADCMIENPADYYYGSLWNKLFRRSIIEAHHLRMDPQISWCEDFIFIMEYTVHASRVFPLNAPVYYYVKTKGSLVSQGLSMAGIVRMKLNVIEYYDDFFRRVYDEADYEARRGEIRSFLFKYAHDDGAIAVLPSTKKLGRERVRAFVTPGTEKNPFSSVYFVRKVLDRAYETIADRYDLELKDLQVLSYVRHAGGTCGFAEIVDFCGLTSVAAASSLTKLAGKQLVRVSPSGAALLGKLADSGSDEEGKLASALRSLSEKLEASERAKRERRERLTVPAGNDEPRGLFRSLAPDAPASAPESAASGSAAEEAPRPLVAIGLGEKAAPLVAEIDRAAEDTRALCLEGVSDEERAQMAAVLGRMMENAKRTFAE